MAKANGKPVAERESQAKTEHQPERPVHEVRIGRIKARVPSRRVTICSGTAWLTTPGYPPRHLTSPEARVAKLADAADLKSAVPDGAWGFDSLPGHPEEADS